ncbi:hypothetical protein DDQ41_20090 [Streptomyces spongiicola]|uniref:Uncharacterized protein n=1 Tax=Streptomyces spongiicola TaxID=1690221 RepID=A0ABM6VA68_9ACTN|nr:hypothetical protein DDQ41_20090 [Streptomyces spongiicola]
MPGSARPAGRRPPRRPAAERVAPAASAGTAGGGGRRSCASALLRLRVPAGPGVPGAALRGPKSETGLTGI